MSLELYLAFVLASTVLIVLPGPNIALIVATSLGYGRRAGLLTVLGTSSGMALQLALTVLGLQALLDLAADLFEWLRWLGAAYLVWLGVRTWRRLPDDLDAVPPPGRSVVWRGALIALTNPKTLLFYAAFLPQFVTPAADPAMQLGLLAATFLGLAVLLDSGWALLAGSARPLLEGRGRLRNRITGGFLVGAGLGLALARRS